jgi:hypothetical protein
MVSAAAQQIEELHGCKDLWNAAQASKVACCLQLIKNSLSKSEQNLLLISVKDFFLNNSSILATSKPCMLQLSELTRQCAETTITELDHKCFVSCLELWEALIEKVGPEVVCSTLLDLGGNLNALAIIAARLDNAKTFVAQEISLSIVCTSLIYLLVKKEAAFAGSILGAISQSFREKMKDVSSLRNILLNLRVMQSTINACSTQLQSFELSTVQIVTRGKPMKGVRQLFGHCTLDMDMFNLEIQLDGGGEVPRIPYSEIRWVNCTPKTIQVGIIFSFIHLTRDDFENIDSAGINS